MSVETPMFSNLPSFRTLAFPDTVDLQGLYLHDPNQLTKSLPGDNVGIEDLDVNSISKEYEEELTVCSLEGGQIRMRANMAFESCPATPSNKLIKNSFQPEYVTQHLQSSILADKCLHTSWRSMDNLDDDAEGQTIKGAGNCQNEKSSLQTQSSTVAVKRMKEKPLQKELDLMSKKNKRKNQIWQTFDSSHNLLNNSFPIIADEMRTSWSSTPSVEEDVQALQRWSPQYSQFFTKSTVTAHIEGHWDYTSDPLLISDSSTTCSEIPEPVLKACKSVEVISNRRHPKNRTGKTRKARFNNILPEMKSFHGCKRTSINTQECQISDKAIKPSSSSLNNADENMVRNDLQGTIAVSQQLVEVQVKSNPLEANDTEHEHLILEPTRIEFGGSNSVKQQHCTAVLECRPAKASVERDFNNPKCNHETDIKLDGKTLTGKRESILCEPPTTSSEIPPSHISTLQSMANQSHLAHKRQNLPSQSDNSVSNNADDSRNTEFAKDFNTFESQNLPTITCQCSDAAEEHAEEKGSESKKRVRPIIDKDQVQASLSTAKLSSILSYLGQVESSNLQGNCELVHQKMQMPAARGLSCCSPREDCSPVKIRESPADDTVSVAGSSQTVTSNLLSVEGDPKGGRGSLATTVFDGVRKKVQELKNEITTHEERIAELEKQKDRLILQREKDVCLYVNFFTTAL